MVLNFSWGLLDKMQNDILNTSSFAPFFLWNNLIVLFFCIVVLAELPLVDSVKEV